MKTIVIGDVNFIYLNKKSTSAICECCQNKRKIAYGYKWEYKSIIINEKFFAPKIN